MMNVREIIKSFGEFYILFVLFTVWYPAGIHINPIQPNTIPIAVDEKIIHTGDIGPDHIMVSAQIVDIDNGTVTNYISIINHTFLCIPAHSAPFNPKYNNSIWLPNKLKERVEQEANSSTTYYEAVIRIARIVHDYIAYGNTDYEKEYHIREIDKGYFTYVESRGALEVYNITVHNKRGVCRHISLVTALALKYVGIKSRIIIGYFLVPVNSSTFYYNEYLTENKKLIAKIHDWIEYYDPDNGWIDVDPTNILGTMAYFPNEIAVAYSNAPTYPYKLYYDSGNFTIEKRQITYGHVWTMVTVPFRYIYSNDTGIIVYRNGREYYVPAGTLAIVPINTKFSFEEFTKNTLLPLQALTAKKRFIH